MTSDLQDMPEGDDRRLAPWIHRVRQDAIDEAQKRRLAVGELVELRERHGRALAREKFVAILAGALVIAAIAGGIAVGWWLRGGA